MLEKEQTSDNVLLSMRGICKSFGKTIALRNGQITVRPGEIHALIGENGAGTSTLMNILCGVLQPDAGEIVFAGSRLNASGVRTTQEAGIVMIHQELNVIKDLTVAQNIFFGREPHKGIFIDDRKMIEESTQVLKRLGSSIDPAARLGSLTIAEQQMVEIARALVGRIRLLILDEPTTALGTADVAQLFTVMRTLREKGVSMIYISHRMNEIFEITDRITVMRDGEFIQTLKTAETSRDELVRLMVGREVKKDLKTCSTVPDDAEKLLEVRHLRAGKKVQDISFALRSGEVLGLSGLMGAGRTETMRALCGIDPVESGEILVRGKPVAITAPGDAMRNGICYLPEDRNASGLMLDKSIMENTVLSSIASFEHCGILDDRKMHADAEAANSQVRTKYASLDENVRNLSGGNRQKVIIARGLINDLDIMVFDEPTKGIDVGAKSEIYSIIKSLASKGKGVIIVSSEIQELQSVCDRILVLSEGHLTGELDIGEVTQEKIMQLAVKRG